MHTKIYMKQTCPTQFIMREAKSLKQIVEDYNNCKNILVLMLIENKYFLYMVHCYLTDISCYFFSLLGQIFFIS